MSIALLIVAGVLLTILLSVIGSVSITTLLNRLYNHVPEWAQPYVEAGKQVAGPIVQESAPQIARGAIAGIETINQELLQQAAATPNPYDDIAVKQLIARSEEIIRTLRRIEERQNAEVKSLTKVEGLTEAIDSAAFPQEGSRPNWNVSAEGGEVTQS